METVSQGSTQTDIKLESSWKKRLKDEFKMPYMLKLKAFLLSRKKAGATIFPPNTKWFAALDRTPFDQVKVVIVGQDPYHGLGQAEGLSFSVPRGVRPPPSLQNILKELESDLGIPRPTHGSLAYWADQGVLLLNAVLTVEEGQANAHQGKGWEQFTDKIIHLLNDGRENLVFVLWGSYAQKKGAFIDRSKHLVLQGLHPSPLSSHRGFFGSRPFSQINEYLNSKKIKPIDWKL